jgi:hypothetical protein
MQEGVCRFFVFFISSHNAPAYSLAAHSPLTSQTISHQQSLLLRKERFGLISSNNSKEFEHEHQ